MEFDNWKTEPRDIRRIQPFCDRLAASWERLSDWRFGQLMVNLMRMYEAEHGHDIFYLEENEMIEIIDEYTLQVSVGLPPSMNNCHSN